MSQAPGTSQRSGFLVGEQPPAPLLLKRSPEFSPGWLRAEDCCSRVISLLGPRGRHRGGPRGLAAGAPEAAAQLSASRRVRLCRAGAPSAWMARPFLRLALALSSDSPGRKQGAALSLDKLQGRDKNTVGRVRPRPRGGHQGFLMRLFLIKKNIYKLGRISRSGL